MDVLQTLREVDDDLRKMLFESQEGDIRKYIGDLLRSAAKQPGRASKLRVDYILERMAELVQDLDQIMTGFHDKRSRLMLWIDRGLSYTARLIDPDSNGQWLVTFDQIVSQATIPDPTDPAAKEKRQEAAKEAKLVFDQALAQADRARSSGSRGLIVPGNSM